jgi:phosphoesterase RecJ-like protein
MNLISVKEAAAFLSGCDGCLIYTHASPDGDTVGSAVALALGLCKSGKNAKIFSVDGVPEKLSFINKSELFITEEPENTNEYTLISVDVAGPQVLGSAKNKSFALSVDHHKVNTVDCERLLVMSDRIACGEIIYLLLQEMGIELDYDIATALYTAISSDSGGFRYDATKPETHIIAAKCLEKGIDFADINRRLFESKTIEQVALIRTAYKNLELLRNGSFAIVALRPEEVEKCGADENDFDCINPIPREIAGVRASAVIRKKGGIIKVSLRSNDDTDVAEMASNFGGGGHIHAAGFSLDCDFDTALETVRKLFSEYER